MVTSRDRSIRRRPIDGRLAAALALLGFGALAAYAVPGAAGAAGVKGRPAPAPDADRKSAGAVVTKETTRPPQFASTLVHVDAFAPPGGNGTSWNRAFRSLQDALDAARVPGSGVAQILVAGGVYRPDNGGGETPGDRRATFGLVNRVEMLGGFAGYGAGNPYLRDVAQFETTLSGDLAGNDLPGRVNNAENSYTVVSADSVGSLCVLDGFTISGGNANGPDTGELQLIRGGGMWVLSGSPRVIDCNFRDNYAAYHGGGMYNRTGSRPSIEGCLFSANRAGLRGGAIFSAFGSDSTITGTVFRDNLGDDCGGAINSHESNLVIIDCGFFDNLADEGGAIHAGLASTLTIEGSQFARNHATIGGGAIRVVDGCALVVRDSRFHEGTATDGAAIFIAATAPAASVRNALFVRNAASGLGGAIFDNSASTFVNCAFSKNSAIQFGAGIGGGGAYLTGAATFINCTLSRNIGCGLRSSTLGPTLANSIVWGNTPGQLLDGGAPASVTHSNIEGGWDGPGSDNMNADPYFVQPAEDNVRLATGSPCLDEGDVAAIPAGVTTDLDGNPRVLGDSVDLGAYEGEQEEIPLVAEDLDVDDNERVILVPSGETFDPLAFPAVAFTNRSGANDATVRVEESYRVLHPTAGGYSELGPVMRVETSLANGGLFATVYVTFAESAISGIDPLDLDLTYYDAAIGNWALAVSRNTANSPGHAGAIGDRSAVIGETGVGFTDELGDYGVFIHAVSRQGVVWANVDHAADFGIGVALCPADAHQPPNGRVGVEDLLAVLRAWAHGDAAGPFDISGDGTINGIDLAHILGFWGKCRP